MLKPNAVQKKHTKYIRNIMVKPTEITKFIQYIKNSMYYKWYENGRKSNQ